MEIGPGGKADAKVEGMGNYAVLPLDELLTALAMDVLGRFVADANRCCTSSYGL